MEKINEEDRVDYEAVELTAPCLHALVEKECLVDCGPLYDAEEKVKLQAAKFYLEFGPPQNYDEETIKNMAGTLASAQVIEHWSDSKMSNFNAMDIFGEHAYIKNNQYYLKVDTAAKQKLRKEFSMQKRGSNKRGGGKSSS